MLKSYSQQSLNLRSQSQSLIGQAAKSSFMATDKYQNWKFFQPSAVTVNSKTLHQPSLQQKAQLSPVRKLAASSSVLTLKSDMAKSKKSVKASFIDHIIEAAQAAQNQETQDFFLTQIQSESILPPIKLGDKHEYKTLLHQQTHVPYLVSKHVRLASERMKLGKLENNHYQHYERADPLETVLQKVKPSELTLTYQPKQENFHKPSLELQKQLNRKLQQEKLNPDMQPFIQETYEQFGMNQDDIEDVQAMLQEEGDKVDFESKEIKFTEHQTEFRTICSKVNKDKSAEIFIKQNKGFNKLNLRDRDAKLYFLSRAAVKEPPHQVERELEQKMSTNPNQEEQYLYRQPTVITKIENRHEESIVTEEEGQSELIGDEMLSQKAFTEILDEYDQKHEQFLAMLGPNHSSKPQLTDRAPHSHHPSDRPSKPQLLQDSEVKALEAQQALEDEEQKKFILLAKLKYENSIKGYDRLPGLKQNLEKFTEALMEKLFSKREPTDDFKYMLKKDNTHSRVDMSKPLYVDDLKRFQKLKEVGDKKSYTLQTVNKESMTRSFGKDINIFSDEAREGSNESRIDQQQQVAGKKIVRIEEPSEKKAQYKTKWYIRPERWGKERQEKVEEEIKAAQEIKIGQRTKEAMEFLVKPYKEAGKKAKVSNLKVKEQ